VVLLWDLSKAFGLQSANHHLIYAALASILIQVFVHAPTKWWPSSLKGYYQEIQVRHARPTHIQQYVPGYT
jgi:hypothetical protein